MATHPSHAAPHSDVCVIVTARKPGLDPLPTLKALREQFSAEIYLVGHINTHIIPPDIFCIPHTNATAARNAAIHQTTQPLIALTDADCIPSANWLSTILKPLQDAQTVGVKGTYETNQKQLVPRFVQVEYESKYSRLASQPTIDFIDTYSAAYRRDILLANDCFDDAFPYLEDQELSFRLAARGYRMVFAPAATVRHSHTPTLIDYAKNKLSIGYWKAQVVRRFPTQGVADSHTPQTVRAQMILVALLGIGLLLAPFLQGGWLVALACAALFLLTTFPLASRAGARSPLLGLLTPVMLLVRALALGLGYLYGTLRPIPNIANTETTIGGATYVIKRLLDVVGGLVGCSITLVLLPFIALAIKLDSKGPIIFKQERIGQRGTPFMVYKFRSMRESAESELDNLIDINALEEPAFKLANDPRITRVGRQLRRWSLDELPQFWNVLRGDMSLVGPRPEETRIVALYNDWQRRRLAVKPGLTGPMQVGGRGDLPLNERVKLEIDYIENYSVWRDVQFIVRTLPAVVRGDGAR